MTPRNIHVICPICGKEFLKVKNKKYCSETCRKKAYKNYIFSTKDSQGRYRDRIMDEEGLQDNTEFNYFFRERTSKNKGFSTTAEYNSYLEEEKARKLDLTVQELRHATYISKKEQLPLYKIIGMEETEYKRRMSRKKVQ